MARNKPKRSRSAAAAGRRAVTESLLTHAVQVARECGASAMLVYLDALPDGGWDAPDDLAAEVFFVTKSEPPDEPDPADGRRVIRVPKVTLTRLGQIKIAVLLALSREWLSPGDRVVCLSGAPEPGTLDTLVVLDVGRDLELIGPPENEASVAPHVLPEVLARAIDIATELGAEGREGKPVGAIFVIGDTDAVMPLTRQLVLNPFQGYTHAERNVLDPRLEETVKEFSSIDGAFIIRGDGAIEAAGTYLKTSAVADEELPRGLGARHQAAAAITCVSECVAITVSQSTGTVTIFRGGRIVTEIEKPRRIPTKKPRRDAE